MVAAVGAAEGLVTYLKQDDRPDVLPTDYKMNAIVAALARKPADLGDLPQRPGWHEIKPDPARAGLDRRLFRHPRRDPPQEARH